MAFYDPSTIQLQLASLLSVVPFRLFGLIFLVVSIICLVFYLNTRFQSAEPNEWLLVIKDGKLKKAGVGLKEFVRLGETIVKFPSRV